MVIVKGAIHYQKRRGVSLMLWNGELYKAIAKLKDKDKIIELKWYKDHIKLLKSKKGVKLLTRKKLRHVICSANTLFKNKNRQDYFKDKNYLPIKINISPLEWNINKDSFLRLEEMVEKTKDNYNPNEKSILLNGAITTHKTYSGICLTVYSKPFSEKIKKCEKINGIAYWIDKNTIRFQLGKYGRKVLPVLKQKQCKLTCSNLIPFEDRKNYFKDKRYKKVKVELIGLSKINAEKHEFFVETKEQGLLAKELFNLRYNVQRETKDTKYAADLFLDNSLIEITTLSVSKNKKDNTPAGHKWGGMAARFLKLAKGAGEIGKDEKHFFVAKKDWLNASGNKIVKDYISWMQNKFNIYFIPVNFEIKEWAKNTAKEIINIKYGKNIH
jgi:hypothetical protein